MTVCCASGFSFPFIHKEDVNKITLFRVTGGTNIALIFMKRKNGGEKHCKTMLSQNNDDEIQRILLLSDFH